MKTLSSDTDPAAERVQLDLLRRAAPARRAALAFSLSRTVMELSRRALRRAHPEASPHEIDTLLVSHHYGEDLARGVAIALARRAP